LPHCETSAVFICNRSTHFLDKTTVSYIIKGQDSIPVSLQDIGAVKGENRPEIIAKSGRFPIYTEHRDEAGIGVFDETENDEIENSLIGTEQKYRSIFEHATEGIFQASVDGRFLSANPSLARLFGYSSSSELMESVRDIKGQLFVDPIRHSEMVRLLREHNVVPNFQARMRRKDGTECWISIDVRTIRNDRKDIVFHEGTMRDITRRKEAEEALAESEVRYRTVIEHSNDGIAIVHDGRHLYVNPKFVEMFGYAESDEILGTPVSQNVHPEDQERVKEINARRMKGLAVPSRYEFKGVTQDGRTVYIEASAAGTTYRNLPVMLIFLRDVTERKKAEEVFLQSHRQLEQLNRAKTKAVNHISHELKTPLSVIQGNVRLLRRRLEGTAFAGQSDPMFHAMEKHLARLFRMQKEADEILRTSRDVEAEGLLDEIDRLKERLGDLGGIPAEIGACWDSVRKWVGELLPGTEAFRLLELRPFLVKAVEKAKQLAAHRRLVVRVEGGGDVQVVMEPAVLRDTIDGLIRNAIENTPDGGMVTVTTEERGDHVLLHVTDTGVGITEEDQQYIFDGLFHAKDTELYASRQPYDFNAGGKGLDLLRMKVYAERFDFGLSVKSTRCRCLPGDGDECPSDLALCPHCTTTTDCYQSGSTTFTVTLSKNGTQLQPARPAIT
jgi:PAS domain S-box-containing protein